MMGLFSILRLPFKRTVDSTTRLKPVPTQAASEVEPEMELQQAITTRQFVFMGFGGTIGAGLLIGSYTALKDAGPGSVLLGFAIAGICVTAMMGSLGELASAYPTTGSFYDYSIRFISRPWGFAMGWNYILNYILTVPLELTVMNIVLGYWTTLNPAMLIPVFIVVLFALSLKGAKWYGKAEHAFGILKLLMLVTFSITAIIIAAGGAAADPRRGHGDHFNYFKEGQAFKNGASGFLFVFVTAGLAYGGTEILGLAAAEAKHPERTMSLAQKIVGCRIVICYFIPLLAACLIVGSQTYENFPHKLSLFVISLSQANIPFLPHLFNAIILVAVFSMANSCIYAASRALRAICVKGMGPQPVARTRNGVPVNALIVVFIVSLLAFINCAPKGAVIFEWLLALASASNFFTWLSINVSQIRLRMAIKKQGKHPKDVLKWVSPMGISGSVVSIAICLVALASLVYTAVVPPIDDNSEWRVNVIIRQVLGIIIVGVLWLGYFCYSLWTKKPHALLIPLNQIDLTKPIDNREKVGQPTTV